MGAREQGDEPALGIVGAGRAGSALAVALHRSGRRVAAISSRTPSHARRLARAVDATAVPSAAEVMRRAGLVLLTVPDHAIAEVAAAGVAAAAGVCVAHCSARLGADRLGALAAAGAHVGVLHPLQAMAGERSAPSLRGAYFRLEGDEAARRALEGIVRDLEGHVLEIGEADRDLYHAAAVLAGNAPVALLASATELLEQCGIDRETAHDALGRLLEGAAANARDASPEAALTGPVVRGDRDAIDAHLAALAGHPDAQRLYAHLVEEMERLVATERRPRPSLHRVA